MTTVNFGGNAPWGCAKAQELCYWKISHGALPGVGGEWPGLSAPTLAGPRYKNSSRR
jgi:hypothetical protein